MDWVRHFWRNGQKLLVFAGVYFVLALLTLGVILVAAAVWPEGEPYTPLHSLSVEVTSEQPTVEDPLEVTVRHCSSADADITVFTSSQFHSVEEPVRVVSRYVNSEMVVSPGCETLSFVSTMAFEEVGTWRLHLYWTTFEPGGDKRQTVHLVSNEFEVVP